MQNASATLGEDATEGLARKVDKTSNGITSRAPMYEVAAESALVSSSDASSQEPDLEGIKLMKMS